MAIITTLLGSLLSGGATGLLGILVQRFFDHKAKQHDLAIIRAQNQHAENLSKIESQRTEMQTKAMVEAAAEERLGVEAEADADLIEASYQHDERSYLSDAVINSTQNKYIKGIAVAMFGMVDWVRGMVRPALTVWLIFLTAMVFEELIKLMEMTGGHLTATQVHEMIMLVIRTILYLATTCVVWWFGTRPPKREGDK